MQCEMNGCQTEAAFAVEVMLGSSLNMCRRCAANRTISGKNELASDFVSVRPLAATYEASVGLTMAEYAGHIVTIEQERSEIIGEQMRIPHPAEY